MDRVKTGIPGLDELIEGGFPNPSSILVTGPPGSGKSIFGLQFLYNGAVLYNEPGFMISVEAYNKDFQWYAERFNWDIVGLQKKDKLIFSSYDPVEFGKFELRSLHSEIILQLDKVIKEIGVKRIVFDSIAPLAQSINNKSKFRTLLYYISRSLKERGCTTLFVSEKPPMPNNVMDNLTEYNVEPFVLDGVIDLFFNAGQDSLNQTLMVRKMIATRFPMSKYLIDIGDNGMQLATSTYKI